MKRKTLISILIPTYNRLTYLKECLNSVISQEGFSNNMIEIVISDNSEGNDTEYFMKDYISRNHKLNIIYNKNKTNLGMIGNWNKLLEIKKGKYFIFLSDDDKFYDTNSLRTLYDNLINYNLDACYGISMLFDPEGKHIGKWLAHKKIQNEGIFYDKFSREILAHGIGFGGILYKDLGKNPKASYYADRDFNLSYLKYGKKVALINNYTFLYRMHKNKSFTLTQRNSFLIISYIYYKHNKLYLLFITITSLISQNIGLYGLLSFLFRKFVKKINE